MGHQERNNLSFSWTKTVLMYWGWGNSFLTFLVPGFFICEVQEKILPFGMPVFGRCIDFIFIEMTTNELAYINSLGLIMITRILYAC